VIRVVIERWAYSPFGVFGNLMVVPVPGVGPSYFCRSLEDEEQNNAPGISCIPRGVYELQLGMYYGGDGAGGKEDYAAYEVVNVPGRKLVKIHRGNTEDHVKGCIVTGSGLGWVNAKWAVTDSKTAFAGFMKAMQDQPKAQLIVQDIFRGRAAA